MKPCSRLLPFLAIASLSVTRAASAQTIDYGNLETLFGEPITASATGKPQKASQVPTDMEIVTQDDIRHSGADNIPDALQFVTGLNFRRSGFDEPELSIRGYDQPWNPRMLVLIDGRPVYEDFYGDVIWAAIPVQLDEIRQIEIVKGPASALFGFNAASGVINIVTYDPIRDSENAVEYRTGTQALEEGYGVATLHIADNAAFRVSYGIGKANEFKQIGVPDANYFGLLQPQNQSSNMNLRWQVTPNVSVSMEVSQAEMSRNFPADQTPENDRTDDQRLTLTANTALGLVQWDNYRTQWNINYQGGQAQIARNFVWDSRLSDLFKVGLSNTFRLSFEFKSNQADGQFFDFATIKQQILAAGGMWDWEISPSLSFTNSARVDHMTLGESGTIQPGTGLTTTDFDRTINVFSFNSGLVYSVTPDDILRTTFGRGYQLPSLDTLAQQINVAYPGGSYWLEGNPHLKPTAVLNAEIDYDHQIDPWNAKIRSALFAQRNSGLFGYDVGTIAAGYNSSNVGASDEVGAEISMKGTTDGGIRWSIGYSYAQIVDHLYPSQNLAPSVYTNFDGGTPKHTVDFGLGYSTGDWEFDLQGRWQSAFQDWRFPSALGTYYPVQVKSYVTDNARIGYQLFKGATLSLTGETVTQERVYERASIPVERRLICGLGYKL